MTMRHTQVVPLDRQIRFISISSGWTAPRKGFGNHYLIKRIWRFLGLCIFAYWPLQLNGLRNRPGNGQYRPRVLDTYTTQILQLPCQWTIVCNYYFGSKQEQPFNKTWRLNALGLFMLNSSSVSLKDQNQDIIRTTVATGMTSVYQEINIRSF